MQNDMQAPAEPRSLLSPTQTPRWLIAVTAVLLVVAALAMRLPRLDAFITPDEMKWVCRSVNFHRGLITGDLASTYQMGHPGVITMWLGVPGLGNDPLEPWLDVCVDSRTRDIIHEEPLSVTRELGRLVFAGRRGIAVLTSLALGLAFLLLLRMFNSYRAATLASVFLLLDPFYLALSRLLHVDAVQTCFTYLSLISLALYLRQGSGRWWAALSGLFGGLAMLNKSPAAGLFLFAVLVIVYKGLGQPRPFAAILRDGLCWFGAAGLIYVLLWPAMWVQPLGTLHAVLDTAIGYASEPHAQSNFFWGQPRPDPGWGFYPVALAFRLTPWTTVGCVLGLIAMVRQRARAAHLWLFIAFVLFYGLFMTVGQKKFDRYLLPAFPCLQAVAAYGWLAVLSWALQATKASGRGNWAFGGLLLAASALGLATMLPHAPYYLTYYNPLLGGPRTAAQKLLVGWGEGLDHAAAYLSALPGSENKEAALRALPEFAPLYTGRSYKESLYDPATTDYVLLYLNEVQRLRCEHLLERYWGIQEPLHVIQLQGVDYVWIYENKTHEAPVAYMATHADPATDAIVVNKPSLLAEQYRGPLPLVTLDPLWDHDRLARTLEDVASRYARVWYVKYRLPDEDPAAQPSWLDLAWDTHAYTLDARSFTDVDLSLWETGGHLAFHGYDRLEQQTALVFGDALRLDGVTVHGPGAQWGRGTRVTLQWTVLAPPDSYLSVYVHLLDDQGFRWGLGDTELLNERFEPTVFWQAGDVLSTELALRVSPGTAPDEYRLILGVYDRLNHQPLEAQGESGESLGGSVSLGTLAVLPSSRRVDPQSDIHLQMRLDAELAAGLRLVGWNRDWERLRFGEALSLALVWQATASLHSDYRLALWLEDAQGNRLAEGLFELASERYPTSQWAAGEVIQRHYPLRVAADAPAGEAQLIVQLVDGDGQPVGQSLTLLSPFLEGRRYDEPDMAYRQAAQVGEAIRLVGYGLSSATVSPGQVLNLTLCWQAISTPPGDYTVFTHLYAPDGSVVAQHDGPPMLAYHPTSAWQPGEYVLDEHPMAIGDLPPGNYRLGVGLYDPSADNTRLPLAVDGERQPDDRLLLDTPVIVQAGS